MTIKSHKGAKDFLMGALLGGVIGVAAVSAARGKGKNKGAAMHKIAHTINQVGKALKSSTNNENNLAELLDWATEGLQLWNKLKRGK